MKSILLACLLAATGQVFAQSIDINDLRSTLYQENAEQSTTLLSVKGFVKAPAMTLTEHDGTVSKQSWQYTFKTPEKNRVVTNLYRFEPENNNSKPMLLLETTDVVLYMRLMNQLAGEGFYYSQATPASGQAQLHFTNNSEEVMVLTNAAGEKIYQLRFQPADPNSTIARKAVNRVHYKKAKPAVHAKPVKTTKKVAPARYW